MKTEFDGPSRPPDRLMQLALRDREEEHSRERVRHERWVADNPDRVALSDLRIAALDVQVFWGEWSRVKRNLGRLKDALARLEPFVEMEHAT